MGKLVAAAVAWAIVLAFAATAHAQAQAGSVADVFAKYDLIGVFAQDCQKEPAKDNLYFVNRAIDPGHVQRDEMSTRTTRDHVTVIDKAQPLGPAEIALSGMRDGQQIDSVWHLDKNRQIAWNTTLAGNKLITDGHFNNNGRDVPWLTKCGSTPK